MDIEYEIEYRWSRNLIGVKKKTEENIVTMNYILDKVAFYYQE